MLDTASSKGSISDTIYGPVSEKIGRDSTKRFDGDDNQKSNNRLKMPPRACTEMDGMSNSVVRRGDIIQTVSE